MIFLTVCNAMDCKAEEVNTNFNGQPVEAKDEAEIDTAQTDSEQKEEAEEAPDSQGTVSPIPLSNREKVKQLIAQAHDSSSYEEASTPSGSEVHRH